MNQKDIDVIRVCLKKMRAFGDEKSKHDIEHTLKAFEEENQAKYKCPHGRKYCADRDITCYKCLNGGKKDE